MKKIVSALLVAGLLVILLVVGAVLLYMAIVKEFEPLLLTPIAFGCIIANFPCTGFMEEPGAMQLISYGMKYEIFPPLIFLGVGAMTDFGPLLANPNTLFLGAAAQLRQVLRLIAGLLFAKISISSSFLLSVVLQQEPQSLLKRILRIRLPSLQDSSEAAIISSLMFMATA